MRWPPVLALLALALALTAPAASADGTTFEGLMATAETAEHNATESRDPAAFEVCAHAYVALADAARTQHPDRTDLQSMALYNAGVCFEHARSISAALAMYQRLEAELPRAQLAARAHARRAQLYLAIASHAEAARELEAYATKWPAERDASDALENALRLRAALGDDAAARKIAERWIKLFGAKRPREAAEAALWLAARARDRGDTDDAVRAFRDWLARFGSRADRHHVVAAYAALGRLQWDASCKTKGKATATTATATDAGLCLASARRTAPPSCGAPPPVAVARDARIAGDAIKALLQAVRLAEASGDEHARILADHARLLLADAKLEVAIAIAMPAPAVGASGDLTPAAQKEFARWFDTWQRELTTARRAYEPLLRARNLRVSVLAASRIAWLSQHAADTLAAAPLPKWKKPKLDTLRKPYCDALRDVTAPLEQQAKDAAAACLDIAGKVGVADETALCVAIFDRHHPAAAAGGERLPTAAPPRIVDVEPEVRYRPAATLTPSPP